VRRPAEEIRRLIDQGLVRYGHGQVREALADWQEAIRLDPGNLEARALIDFVQVKLPRQAAESALRNTAVVMPAIKAEAWGADEDTDPEDLQRVTPRAMAAVDDEELGEPRHRTIESPLPGLLAKTTSPEWNAFGEQRNTDEAAPLEMLSDEDTRKLGGQDPGDTTRVAFVPAEVRAPAQDPARVIRRRTSELVDRCRTAFRAGKLEEAVSAAEEALKQGEAAPPPGIPEVIEPARPLFEQAFMKFIGGEKRIPLALMSLSQLALQDLDHRAGFLMSRIDGATDVEQLVDVASMPRFDTLRFLSSLKLLRAIKIG
jgi:hypothetical protein